jgi:hypothetical protein
MNPNPDDIDFARLSDERFEEFCYDLLSRVGYSELTWRRGGSDQGRDVEATYYAPNPLLGQIRERWFVQAKRYSRGVPPEKLESADIWASANHPQHLLIMVSSHLTSGARTWLERTRAKRDYLIHELEGKELKEIVVRYPDLVERYFLGPDRRLLRDLISSWESLGVMPSIEQLEVLRDQLPTDTLELRDVAFLWLASLLAVPGSSSASSDWDFEPRTFQSMPWFDAVARLANTDQSPIRDRTMVATLSEMGMAAPDEVIVCKRAEARVSSPSRGLYAFAVDPRGRGLETLLLADGRCQIRTIQEGGNDECDEAALVLWKIMEEQRRQSEVGGRGAHLNTTVSPQESQLPQERPRSQ